MNVEAPNKRKVIRRGLGVEILHLPAQIPFLQVPDFSWQ